MCLFIETIRIDHGRVCNLSRHNRRLNDTRAHFWPKSTPLQLSDYLSSPGCGAGITGAGIVKARNEALATDSFGMKMLET